MISFFCKGSDFSSAIGVSLITGEISKSESPIKFFIVFFTVLIIPLLIICFHMNSEGTETLMV